MPIKITNQDGLAKSVLSLYEGAEQAMMRNYSRRFATMTAGHLSHAAMMATGTSVVHEVDSILQELRDRRIQSTERAIRKAYAESVRAALEELESIRSNVAGPSENEISALSGDILTDMNKRLDSMDTRLKKQYSVTFEDIVSRIAESVTDGERVSDAVERELARLADGSFPGFTDAAGRNWNFVSYAETVAVSALETAVIKGYMHTLEMNNYDLVLIEGHYGGCPICTAWNGVVISITGITEGYPTFDDAVRAGCFHPRCSHHLSLYLEGMGDEVLIKPRPIKKPHPGYSMSQKQRRLEAEIRRWKRRALVSINPMAEKTAYAHIRYYQREIRKIIKDADLKRKRWREGSGKG